MDSDSRFHGAIWRSKCNNGQCVEIASQDGWVGVRDSKDGATGPVSVIHPRGVEYFYRGPEERRPRRLMPHMWVVRAFSRTEDTKDGRIQEVPGERQPVELAVAVVIGATFSGLVQALVKDLITPLIAAITGGGGPDFAEYAFKVNGSRIQVRRLRQEPAELPDHRLCRLLAGRDADDPAHLLSRQEQESHREGMSRVPE